MSWGAICDQQATLDGGLFRLGCRGKVAKEGNTYELILDVENETSLSSFSLRHVMQQYFGIFQPSSGIMMSAF